MTSTFKLIDEQTDFVVVDKAVNINFHDEGNIGTGLFSQVKLAVGINALYPVHRLDKMTSGLVIFAKNQATAVSFQQLFSRHHIEKYYIAISDKTPKKKQGLVKGDMVKARRGMWKLLRSTDNPAITQFFSTSIATGIRGFILKPHSGKTHQIRVALASVGAPILGDPLYGKSASERGYLHAYSLRFTLNDQSFKYISPPTCGTLFIHDATKEWLKSIDLPWHLPWPQLK